MKLLLFGVVLAASAVGLGEARAEPAAGPVIEYRDVGNAQDFDQNQNIYLEP
ncbi:MAG: hypothetical protein ACLQM8_26590 [Limisphaerales bacterium]